MKIPKLFKKAAAFVNGCGHGIIHNACDGVCCG